MTKLNWILGFFYARPNDWSGDDNGLTVVEVIYAKEGEAEGGLAAFARFLGAGRDVPLSPPGWYSVSYSNRVGYGKKNGPFDTAELCQKAFEELYFAEPE